MHRTFRYPLHPTTAQETVLLQWLGVCCDLYNAALQERRDAWRMQRRSVTKYEQHKALTEIRGTDPAIAEIPAWILRSSLDRLDGAFQAFFRRVKAGNKPGFPRWRSKRRYDSFNYPATMKTVVTGSGRSVRLHVPVLGTIKVNVYRPLRGKPLTVTIRRDATGRWWACIVCDVGEAPAPKVDPSRIVGIDLGITSLVATSHGEVIENPRHAAKAAAKLAAQQRVFARRKKGSASRNRARILVAKTHQHIANQRRNHAWHVAKKLVAENDVIAHEDLDVKALSRGMLGKHVNFAGWTLLLYAIRCKAEEAGAVVVAVDPRGTSQQCSGCGTEVRKGLSDRWHKCPRCSASLDRDINAAINIRRRGVEALGTSVVTRGVSTAPKARRSRKNALTGDQL